MCPVERALETRSQVARSALMADSDLYLEVSKLAGEAFPEWHPAQYFEMSGARSFLKVSPVLGTMAFDSDCMNAELAAKVKEPTNKRVRTSATNPVAWRNLRRLKLVPLYYPSTRRLSYYDIAFQVKGRSNLQDELPNRC